MQVSAPFHCALMKPAADRLAGDLDAVAMHDLRLPLVNNFCAQEISTASEAREGLKQQVANAVRWEESMRLLAARGVERFVEAGPGKVLTGLLRNIDAPSAALMSRIWLAWRSCSHERSCRLRDRSQPGHRLGLRRGVGQAGARVVGGARQQDKLARLVEEIRSSGGEAAAVELNLRSQDSIRAAAEKARELYGNIDILVNNAGVTRDGWRCACPSSSGASDRHGPHRPLQAIQAVLPGMVRAWARIVNISSVVGLAGNPGQANYVASKAGLIGLTKALAQEVASRNITVNAVAPGFIQTAMTESLDEKIR